MARFVELVRFFSLFTVIQVTGGKERLRNYRCALVQCMYTITIVLTFPQLSDNANKYGTVPITKFDANKVRII